VISESPSRVGFRFHDQNVSAPPGGPFGAFTFPAFVVSGFSGRYTYYTVAIRVR